MSFVVKRPIYLFHVIAWAFAHGLFEFYHPLWVVLSIGEDFLQQALVEYNLGNCLHTERRQYYLGSVNHNKLIGS